ncbi:hypothetical protein AXK57_06735 [Tsukamurella pulmonis]|uniref:DUF4307 domain-containing protein n=1 Tax=Tsukamurella pulmonis TaxID=47312 RepID=A0A1H1CR99_9ACTN|nr:DUF4307 domain-containing protein [Tsukamurella pulmonis]KXO89802.1 hypothetical protein AXK56_06485 [Tsukamurella pulmonis]KXP11057.1 hypothetical protein AXK57_06735 [Tsukamurella pulmonis]RDH12426.1 DUF4307 domain-containing protein [Tsukamurella pulmonis]SDQ66418.1 protein of unknown function [Tsukamurella pulmonis]SUP23318.1 Uncharacterised protein [Tsukamurella pulmonis]
MSTERVRPSDRYPDERDPAVARRVGAIGLVVVVVLGVGLAWLGYQKFSRQPVKGETAGYQLLSDSAVEVQVTVTRTDPQQAVSCIVYAKNKAGDEIGRREFYVPPSPDTVVVLSSEVRTTEPPAVGDVFGCGTNVPAYLDRA